MATAAKPPSDRLPAPVRKYLTQTQRPLVCLVFAAPLLLVYEIGVMAFPDAVRNGADVWMRGSLGALGLGGYFLLPLLTVSVLLAWHHTTRQPWRLPRGVLLGMCGESVLLGFALIFIAHAATGWTHGGNHLPVEVSIEESLTPVDRARLGVAQPVAEKMLAQIVEYIGAGLYEEVLFRLLLLPTLLALLASCMKNRAARVAAAVAATSLLFAAAHHLGPHGEPLDGAVFCFRTLAGVFFAMLFLRRGFGIAIGAHAAYDLIAGLGY